MQNHWAAKHTENLSLKPRCTQTKMRTSRERASGEHLPVGKVLKASAGCMRPPGVRWPRTHHNFRSPMDLLRMAALWPSRWKKKMASRYSRPPGSHIICPFRSRPRSPMAWYLPFLTENSRAKLKRTALPTQQRSASQTERATRSYMVLTRKRARSCFQRCDDVILYAFWRFGCKRRSRVYHYL